MFFDPLQFAMQFLTTLLAALALAASATADPIHVGGADGNIVDSPPIMSPQAGDMWEVGSNQNVTWNTSGILPGDTNYTGAIFLGYDDGSGSEHLYNGKHPRPAHGGTTPTLPQTPLQVASSLRPVASR